MTRRVAVLVAAVCALAVLSLSAGNAIAAGKRISVTGEVIDTWCYLTEIMVPEGTAHHQCAIWCAAGGIPVGILDDAGKVYMVMKYGDEDTNVRPPAIMKVQTHRVSVQGDLFERDGINYLFVDQVVADEGIVKLNHEDFGIQPGG